MMLLAWECKAPDRVCTKSRYKSVIGITRQQPRSPKQKRALAWPGLVWHATKATVRDYAGHMDWPACWDEVLRFSIRQHWIQRLITS